MSSEGIDITKNAAAIAFGSAQVFVKPVEARVGGTSTAVLGVWELAEFLFAQTDQMEPLLSSVEKLSNAILAGDKVSLMSAVGKAFVHAHVAANALKDSKPPKRPLTDDEAAIVKFQTRNVIITLGNRKGYWCRLFNPGAVYSLHDLSGFYYGDFDPPRESDDPNLVFEYRLTLPAYLEALTIRLIVFLTLIPDFRNREGMKEELNEIAAYLDEVHRTIREGILSLRTPGPAYIILHSSYSAEHGTSSPSEWRSGLYYGAVERYAAYGVVDTYPSSLYSHLTESYRRDSPKEFDAAYKRFVAKYTVGTLARWKRVYRNVGLDDLWKLVNFWKGLAGQRQSDQYDHSGDWSLREVDHIVAQALLNQRSTADPNQMISLRNLVAMLGGSSSSLRQSLS